MGVSGRQLAKILGVSEGAVRKARADRIAGAVLADGTYDPEKAAALWGRNTDPSMQREAAPVLPAAVQAEASTDAGLSSSQKGRTTPDVNIARAALIIEKARRETIKRKKEEKSVLDRAKTLTLVQTLARNYRDGLLGFTDKHYSEMAAELGVDAFQFYQVLDKHLRGYVEKTIDGIKVEVGA